MKLEFPDRFSKHTHMNFNENPSIGSRGVSCGQTDRFYEANSRFRNFVNTPKNVWSYTTRPQVAFVKCSLIQYRSKFLQILMQVA